MEESLSSEEPFFRVIVVGFALVDFFFFNVGKELIILL
jgi:hypothetical protein